MSEIDAKRAANRAAFPGVAQIVDEFREAFGDGVKTAGGAEGGRSFGVPLLPADEACGGCVGAVCGRVDRAAVFCGHRLASSPNQPLPIGTYRAFGFGMGRRR